jgi:hypothetical protein
MRVVRVPDHVVSRSFGSETVVLNLATGQYHGLNETAGRMLEVLSEVGEVGKAATVISAEYGRQAVEIEADLNELCDLLVERSLLDVAEA